MNESRRSEPDGPDSGDADTAPSEPAPHWTGQPPTSRDQNGESVTNEHVSEHVDAPAAAADTVEEGWPRLPGEPNLPSSATSAPSVVPRPTGDPLVAPPEAAAPNEANDLPVDRVVDPTVPKASYVDAMASMAGMTGAISESAGFAPLRSDSPPALLPTWWLRSALLITMLAAIGITMWTEFNGEPGDVGSSSIVLGVHALAAVLLLAWSQFAMGNAGRIVPPSRYQGRSRGSVAVMLWLIAAAAPAGAYLAYRRLEDRLSDPDDLTGAFVMIAVVLVSFICIWLPFRYLGRQASRVGAPSRAMLAWFYAPLISGVGGVLAVAVGLRSFLAEGGLDPTERLVQVGVAYALPMFVFALATWRAVTVFDEVIDLRWRRWRTEWEQTLDAMADQPPPGPEASPEV